MVEHSGAMGSESQGSHGRINASLDFVSRLLSLEPLYSKANPGAAPRFEKLNEQDRNYLAHEYFNKDWVPMYFSQVAEQLSSAKLDYATSANYLDAVEAINLTKPQQELLLQIPAQGFRQTVRDYCVNQQFRKDYWVKGLRRLSRIEQIERIRELRFVLAVPHEDIQLKVVGALGEAILNENIYKAVINYLSDYKIRTFSQIEKDLQVHQIAFAQILEVFMIMCSDGRIALVQEEAVINKAKKHTLKLNAHLVQKARFGSDISYLASPVTGGGVVVNRFNQLFLFAINNGKKTPAEWAQLAWSILSSQGQSLVKEGKTLETVQENLAELTSQAVSFSQKTLPILKLMQIV